MLSLARVLRASVLVNRSRLQGWSLSSGGISSQSSLAAQAARAMAPKLSEQIASVHEVVKSQSDNNAYRGLVLKNGMKVICVSDPTTDKSAAALNVQVGCMTDPSDIPGLAHFCEHMLFLGTKKYPEENAYTAFLGNHGGSSNAFTATDHTCYFFDIPPEHYKSAADIFSQFFVEPLFDASCTSRELNAVDSEHEKNIKQDMWRLWRLEGVTGDKDHDFYKFGTGSKATLETIPLEKGIDVRKALLDFHGKYYSSNIMSVCLLGKEDLDTLSDMAIEMFGGVANKNAEAPQWKDHPWKDDNVQVEIKVVPVKDLRQMILSFPVPDYRKDYKSNPGHYLSHLIGHEGEGSLLSYLKEKGWVNSLSGGARPISRGFASFAIQMNLSPEGLKHADDITTAVFQYIEMLRNAGPQKWIFEELKNIGDMHFKFKPKETPINYVSNLTDALHNYEWEDVLSATYCIDQYKPELISELLGCLVPGKVRITMVSQEFRDQTDTEEQYYGTNYSVSKIADTKIGMWESCGTREELHLPTPNIFIPTNFDLYPEESRYTREPTLLINENSNKLWFQQDKEYLLPNNMARFDLRTPLAYQDPISTCLSHLAILCFNDANNEYFYPAYLAGLGFNVENNLGGISLKIQGYNEKQQAMLEKICERLLNFKIDPSRFDVLKESYVRKLKNFAAEQPYQHALYYTNVVLFEKFWTQDEVLAVVDSCTVEGCQDFYKKLFSKFYIESLVHGNMSEAEAKTMGETIQRVLKCDTYTHEETKNLREFQLKPKTTYDYKYINQVHPTNSTMTYYQVGIQDTDNLKLSAVNDLFCHILEEPCYNTLRTKEQLGYIVTGGVRRSQGTQGIRVIVQSDKNPTAVAERIDNFMNEALKQHIDEMTGEDFENNKKALIALKLEKPKKLEDLNNYQWREISGRTYLFSRKQKEADEVAKLTKEELINFYETHVLSQGEKHNKLIMNIESKSNPGDRTPGVKIDYPIDDLSKFKKDHVLLDRPLPSANL